VSSEGENVEDVEEEIKQEGKKKEVFQEVDFNLILLK